MESSISEYSKEELEYISKFKNDIKNLVSEFTIDTQHFNSYKVYAIFMNNEDFEYESILEDITTLGYDVIRDLENPDIPRELKLSCIFSDINMDCGLFYADRFGTIYKIFPVISSSVDKVHDWDSITSHDSNMLFRPKYIEESNKLYMYANTDYIDSFHDNHVPDGVNKCVIAVKKYILKLARLIEQLINNVFKEELIHVYRGTYNTPL